MASLLPLDRRSTFVRWLHRRGVPGWGQDRNDVDPRYIARLRDRLDVLFGPGGPFEVTVEGLETLPPPPVLLVSNHSGGSTVLDMWGLLWAWYRTFASSRLVHVLAHEILLATRITGPFIARCGAVPASRDLAHEILHDWQRDLLVMPGGADDTWRPWRDRYRVQFAGRTGYARLALRAGVPIVPVANAGPHETLRVLTDGRRFARRFGLHRLLRMEVFPVHLSLPWGVCVGPWPHLPLPSPLRYRFGPPIRPPRGVAGAHAAEAVADLDATTRAAVQGLLDGLDRGTPLPSQPELVPSAAAHG
jgi:1-acyl-sn-glycerol-3-phosphate acyltransferase